MADLSALDKQRLELVQKKREHTRRLHLCFDANAPDSRPTPKQQSIIEDNKHRFFWVLGGNRSGKTQLGSRIISWWFTDSHPYMKRPERWGTKPLQMIIISRTMEQLVSEIWENKVKPLLPPGTYKEERVGNQIARVVNPKNGNRIIFASHNNADEAREKIQAFTANVVWLDEMPGSASLVSELMTRVAADDGFLYATFTPLERVPEIRQIIETPLPKARKETLLLLDNPVFKGREEEMIAQMRVQSAGDEAQFRARMFGEWYEGDSRVFAYISVRNYVEMPPNYSRTWPHVAVVDPSASGLTGLTVWGRAPDQLWYCVLAEYVNGSAAFELVDTVERLIAPFNIIERRCDCNPAGFYKEANSSRRNLNYYAISDKKDRKLETIDKLNVGWKTGRLFVTRAGAKLGEELAKAVWSERTEGHIVGESRLHLCDTARYFYDRLPAVPEFTDLNPEQAFRQAWRAQKARQEKAQEEARYRIVAQRSRLGRRLGGTRR